MIRAFKYDLYKIKEVSNTMQYNKSCILML